MRGPESRAAELADLLLAHRLLVYTAVPGSESYEKLQLLSVIGAHTAGAAER